MKTRIRICAVLAVFVLAFSSCASQVKVAENIKIVDTIYDRFLPDDLSAFNDFCPIAITGEVIGSFSYVEGSTPNTVFYVRVASVLKGTLRVGDVVPISYNEGDMNEYLYLALHGWDKGSFSSDLEIEKARNTILRFPFREEFNAEPGGLNLYMQSYYANSEMLNPWVTMAALDEGTYHYKNSSADFKVTLDDVKAIVTK